jgi:hypothetical protein
VKLPKDEKPFVVFRVADRKLPLSSQQLSRAWRWLENSPNPNPPRGLRHLKPLEWHAVASLLYETLEEQEESLLH